MLIAGRPSTGKTALALSIAKNIVMRKDPKAVAIFSLEISKDNLMSRFVAMTAEVSLLKLKAGQFSKTQWRGVVAAAARFPSSLLYIDDSPNLTPEDIGLDGKRLARKLDKKGPPLGLVLIDYFQLLRGAHGTKRRVPDGTLMSRLKRISVSLKVPFIVTSSIPRPSDAGRTTPMLGDFKEPSLTHSVDTIVLLPQIPRMGKRRRMVIVAKNRRPKTGPVPVIFDSARAYFT